MTVINSDGTYVAVIEDKGVLNLKSITRTTSSTCYDMSSNEIIASDKIKTIDDFLRANYPLEDFNIQVIQVSVRPGAVSYRFLYANPKLKQIQIYLDESDGTANVNKAAYINYGYDIDEAVSTNPDYQKIVDVLKNSNLAGLKTPFYT